MITSILSFLPWALPPLIGAAIGYITNAIAIAMLFKPYTEKRFLKIKIPMTPGIIPKERYELSSSIGRLVSRELLTEDAVKTQISSKKFIQEMDKTVHSFLRNLLKSPLDGIKKTFSSHNEIPFQSASPSRSLISTVIQKFLTSSGLSSLIDTLLDKSLQHLGKKKIKDFSGTIPSLTEKIVGYLFLPENRKKISRIIRKAVEEGIYTNVKFSLWINKKNSKKIASFILRVYDYVFPEIIEFLQQPEIKKELELRGRFLLEDILEKLNKVQRFLLSVGQYDKTLEENMGAIVRDIIQQFKGAGSDPDNKQKLLSAVQSFLERLSRTSLGDAAARWEGDFSGDMEKTAEDILSLLFTPDFSRRLTDGIVSFLNRQGDVSLNTLSIILFDIPMEELKDKVIPLFFSTDNKDDGSAFTKSYFFTTFVPELFNTLTSGGTKSLWEILNLDNTLVDETGHLITLWFLELIIGRIPEILDSVDIQTLVVKKIDSLAIEKVEELILEVVKKQLRWINIFGALLGSLIGGTQVLLNLTLR